MPIAVQTARYADDKTVPRGYLVALRCFIAVDFAVQIIADCIRAQGLRESWLIICQVYFVR